MATTHKTNRNQPLPSVATGGASRLKFGPFHFFADGGYVCYQTFVTIGDKRHHILSRLGEQPNFDQRFLRIQRLSTKAAGRAWAKLIRAKISEPSFLWEKKAVAK